MLSFLRSSFCPLSTVFCLLLSGCVHRILHVESDPPGAIVSVDGEPKGSTPVDIPFTWYGSREIELEKPGFLPFQRIESISAPWWQYFPLDFVTDLLCPFPLYDTHEFRYTLQPETADHRTLEETLLRAEEYRRKARENPE